MALKATEYTVSSLAVELRMDRRKVGKLLEGLEPHRKNKSVGYYWLRDVFDHIQNGSNEKLDPQQEQAKLNRERRLQVAQDRALKEGELCETAVVEKYWSDLLVNLKNNILGIPHKVAHRVMAAAQHSEGVLILETACRETLENLADTGIPETTPKPDSQQGVKPAAKTKRKSVGRSRKKAVAGSKRRTRAVAN